ncbi:MAG: tyrosine-protein kinase family protein [Clostridia bacterium]|nr:tyrosine-protein kinase family protein [Clostridia bacterium]
MHTAGIHFDVEDREYFARLEEYIKLNYPRFFQICNKAEESDYIITDYLNKRNSRNIITIKESDGDIKKLQRASGICIGLIGIIYKNNDISTDQSRERPLIICVTSALGGAGKTKISTALAKHASAIGSEVLYMNLDPSSASEIKMNENAGNDMTKLQYCLENNRKIYGTLLKEVSNPVADGVYECITNISPVPDSLIGSRSADRLIEAARADEFHDLIIMDVPSFMSDTLLKLLQGADTGILITGREPLLREQVYMEYLKTHCQGKIKIVKNRCSDNSNSVPEDDGKGTNEGFGKAIMNIYKSLRE